MNGARIRDFGYSLSVTDEVEVPGVGIELALRREVERSPVFGSTGVFSTTNVGSVPARRGLASRGRGHRTDRARGRRVPRGRPNSGGVGAAGGGLEVVEEAVEAEVEQVGLGLDPAMSRMRREKHLKPSACRCGGAPSMKMTWSRRGLDSTPIAWRRVQTPADRPT